MTAPDTGSGSAATRHRPTDPALLAREARKLAAQGLRERDIERCLGLEPGQARPLLAPVERPADEGAAA